MSEERVRAGDEGVLMEVRGKGRVSGRRLESSEPTGGGGGRRRGGGSRRAEPGETAE